MGRTKASTTADATATSGVLLCEQCLCKQNKKQRNEQAPMPKRNLTFILA